jgi:hypothetical protein
MRAEGHSLSLWGNDWEVNMRALIAVALFTGGLLALHAPADSADPAKKRIMKPRTSAATVQSRTYSRQQVECERAQYEDPSGAYGGYPCWARGALGSGTHGGSDRP